jgi:hypothetical protein
MLLSESVRKSPWVLFVAAYGLDEFEVCRRAQYELTKLFSAAGRGQSRVRALQ